MPNNENLMVETSTKDSLEMIKLGKKARVVFHDLANHFTSLSLSIEHLEESLARDRERISEYTKKTERTRQQIEYVSKILHSHIQNQKNETIKIKRVIEETLEPYREKLSVQKINFAVKLRPDLTVWGPRNALIHVIENLVSNAIDSFSNIPTDRRKTISIKTARFRNEVVIKISDNGSGIKQSHLPRIFDGNFTTKAKGHGVGLCSVREILSDSFNGKIEVESSSKGTSFTVRIPVPPKTKTPHDSARGVFSN